MATDYHHGVRVIELNEGTRAIRTISTAVIGMVCIADDADPKVFPLDTPVLLANPQASIGKAGDKGTLAPSLQGICDQANPLTVVTRVASGKNENEMHANVAGSVNKDGRYTGMKSFLTAKARLGVAPRILVAPGLEIGRAHV